MTPGYAWCSGCREWAKYSPPGHKWYHASELAGYEMPRREMCQECAYELAEEIASTHGAVVSAFWLVSCRREEIDRDADMFGGSSK